MVKYDIGSLIDIKDIEYEVIGYIVYKNPNDNNKWTEYMLDSDDGEFWLSCDDENDEYSISHAFNKFNGTIGPEWKKVDEGTQIVVDSDGEVDVDTGEQAKFVEYEDDSEENTLSMEIWEDGTEVSKGFYIDKEDIVVVEEGYEDEEYNGGGLFRKILPIILGILGFILVTGIGGSKVSHSASVYDYLITSKDGYEYVTSITGKNGAYADVYKAKKLFVTDDVAKDIVKGIKGETEVATKNSQDATEGSISIVTRNEYILVYYPKDIKDTVYVQISDRKYAYTSDQEPYRARTATNNWYRMHYYNSAYRNDSYRYGDIPSSYKMYKGPIMHDLGNGDFDSYASSIRQSNVNSRSSSGGGLSSGK